MSVATEIVTALESDATVAAAFNTIAHAWTDEEIIEVDDSKLPAVLVYPGDDAMQENPFDEFVANMVTELYEVIIICPHAGVTERKDEIRDVLVGWQYPSNPAYDLMELAGGEILQIQGKYVWWKDTYQTRIQRRQRSA